MKAHRRLEKLKQQFERLRKDSLAAVGNANESLHAGLQQFADKEIKALQDYYDSALSSLKSHKSSGTSIKSTLQTQFDLLQETFTRLVAHARESVETVTKAEPAPKKPKKAAKKPVEESMKKPVKDLTMKKPVKTEMKKPVKLAAEVAKPKKPAVKKTAKKAAAKKTPPAAS